MPIRGPIGGGRQRSFGTCPVLLRQGILGTAERSPAAAHVPLNPHRSSPFHRKPSALHKKDATVVTAPTQSRKMRAGSGLSAGAAPTGGRGTRRLTSASPGRWSGSRRDGGSTVPDVFARLVRPNRPGRDSPGRDSPGRAVAPNGRRGPVRRGGAARRPRTCRRGLAPVAEQHHRWCQCSTKCRPESIDARRGRRCPGPRSSRSRSGRRRGP